MVIVLFNPSNRSQFRGTILSVIQKVQEENQGGFYFWPAESSSKDGKRVVEKYGNGTDDQVIFLVPSTQQTPVFVDRIDAVQLVVFQYQVPGPALKDFDFTRLCERINIMMESLNMEREQIEQWRHLRRQQERELDLVATQENVSIAALQKEIRDARLARTSQEPTQGYTLRVRTPVGVVSRMFGVASHYQEVYDWVGSQNEMPLHFTLHRGDNEVILHSHQILADETVNLSEQDEKEVTTLLKDQVSFKGNCGHGGSEDMSKTIVDEESKEEDQQAGKNEEEEEEVQPEESDGANLGCDRQKRKRKDKRTPKEKRAKKQKAETKESQKY